MEASCHLPPANKKVYIEILGKILVANYGKKKNYSPEEVKKANGEFANMGDIDFHCWGMSVFCDYTDFDNYHIQTGESCNYEEMRNEMLNGLSLSDDYQIIDIPNFEIDTSPSSTANSSESLLDGIGELFSGDFD